MMNDGIRSSNGGLLPERKNYSRFVAQAAKNTVKKKLMEIRRSGARAADEIIDFLLKSGDKSHTAGVKRTNAFDFAETIRSEIEMNRSKWRNFLIELATRFDPEILASFGEVAAARIVNDRETGRAKGFGFVEMTNDEEARKAIEALNGSDIGGRKAVVNEARPREPRQFQKRF